MAGGIVTVRFVYLPRLAAAVVVLVAGAAAPSAAQEVEVASLRELARLAGEDIAAAPAQVLLPVVPPQPIASKRPEALVPLYLSLGALNALDVHSTRRALSRGAVERNPILKGVARNPAALIAVKAAGTGTMIFAAEKMWKKNRTAAVIFMVAANSAMAWVVQHNYRAVR